MIKIKKVSFIFIGVLQDEIVFFRAVGAVEAWSDLDDIDGLETKISFELNYTNFNRP